MRYASPIEQKNTNISSQSIVRHIARDEILLIKYKLIPEQHHANDVLGGGKARHLLHMLRECLLESFVHLRVLLLWIAGLNGKKVMAGAELGGGQGDGGTMADAMQSDLAGRGCGRPGDGTSPPRPWR